MDINWGPRARQIEQISLTPITGTIPDGSAMALKLSDDSIPIIGDHLDHIVTWKSGPIVNIEQGQPFNFRFRLRSAKLFASELLLA